MNHNSHHTVSKIGIHHSQCSTAQKIQWHHLPWGLLSYLNFCTCKRTLEPEEETVVEEEVEEEEVEEVVDEEVEEEVVEG